MIEIHRQTKKKPSVVKSFLAKDGASNPTLDDTVTNINIF